MDTETPLVAPAGFVPEKVNILLVDDQPENLYVLQATLAELGQNLVLASSGEEALRHLLQQDFAVIVLDVVMPGMDGFETAYLIRQRSRSKHTPIIFLTGGHDDDTRMLRAYALGAVDYMLKPFEAEILRSKVTVFVELFNKTRQVQWQADRLRELVEKERAASAILAERAAELARSNVELEQFAYVTSHDLQEPLRMIASYVQFLEKKYRGTFDTEGEEFMTYVVEGVKRMHAMIQDLLTYSRVGRSGDQRARIDCREVIKVVLENLKLAAEEAGAQIRIGDLPVVVAQKTELISLFQNLIDNAIKFRGDEPPEVEVFAERAGNYWEITVRDNGIGIEPQYREKIFMMFRRLHDRTKYPGTGLGLTIVKKLVTHCGGRIWVEATSGRGTTFKFTLPAIGYEPANGSVNTQPEAATSSLSAK